MGVELRIARAMVSDRALVQAKELLESLLSSGGSSDPQSTISSAFSSIESGITSPSRLAADRLTASACLLAT